MSRFWSPIVQTLPSYVPEEQPEMGRLVKLNTNESHYGPSPKALTAIAAENTSNLSLYSDPKGVRLKQATIAPHGLDPKQVFLGNGSDEVLTHVFQGLLKQKSLILFLDITYSFYLVYCKLFGIEYETVPLSADFAINLDDHAKLNGALFFLIPMRRPEDPPPRSEIERLLKKILAP